MKIRIKKRRLYFGISLGILMFILYLIKIPSESGANYNVYMPLLRALIFESVWVFILYIVIIIGIIGSAFRFEEEISKKKVNAKKGKQS